MPRLEVLRGMKKVYFQRKFIIGKSVHSLFPIIFLFLHIVEAIHELPYSSIMAASSRSSFVIHAFKRVRKMESLMASRI